MNTATALVNSTPAARHAGYTAPLRHYHGTPACADRPACIAVRDPETGRIWPLTPVIRYTPQQHSWGTSDGAARNLAVSLLLDTLGDTALCPACKGTERIVYQTHTTDDAPAASPFVAWTCDVDPDPARLAACPNLHCAAGLVLPVEEFTDQVVSRLPAHRSWTITRAQILAWVAALAAPPT